MSQDLDLARQGIREEVRYVLARANIDVGASPNESCDEAPAKPDEELPFRFVESLGLLGHELRNALSCIICSTELMQAWRPVTDRERARLAMIDRAARRMGHIVSNTLEYAQILRGALVIHPQQMDLRSACEDVIEEALAVYAVTIELNGGDSEWGCWDPVAIAQVLSNLLRNAIVHGTVDQPIAVALTSTELFVSVTVTNQGPTVRPEFFRSIFEPFGRGEVPGERARRGVGLGLYVARRLVEAHRGTITLESSVERGTSFTVNLPRRVPVQR
jgi:signal transduction histidine kinase